MLGNIISIWLPYATWLLFFFFFKILSIFLETCAMKSPGDGNKIQHSLKACHSALTTEASSYGTFKYKRVY